MQGSCNYPTEDNAENVVYVFVAQGKGDTLQVDTRYEKECRQTPSSLWPNSNDERQQELGKHYILEYG
jgi:hypothetical protein